MTNFFFQDSEKLIDTINIGLNEVKHYVHTHNGQNIGPSRSKLAFKDQKQSVGLFFSKSIYLKKFCL